MSALGSTPIPRRFVIVKTGTFCGKPARPVIYANAADVTPQIAKPDAELTFKERQALKAVAIYNSSGRKRFREDFAISDTNWKGLLASLASKGLVKASGAITVDGANQARKYSDMILNPYSLESKDE